MMVPILLALHLPLLLWNYRVLEATVGRIIALLFLAYIGTFTVLKPALLYYFDFYLPYSTNAQPAVISLLTGSLIFLAVQYGVVRWFCRHCPAGSTIKLFNLTRSRSYGVWLTFIILMALSFAGSVAKFSDFGFLWSSVSNFDADMAQANGSYYLNFVSGSVFYGTVLVVGYYSDKWRPFKLLVLTVLLLAITFIWARLAARTGFLVVLVAWLAVSISIERQRKINIIYIACFGYVLLGLLYVGNLLRLGTFSEVNPSTAIFGAAIAATADTNPVDNAVLLYDEMHNHEGTDFVQFAGAVTPLVLIPSSIFPVKMPADKDGTLTRMLFPEGAPEGFFHEGGTLTFTVPASGYADWGYAGVAVASFVYAVILCFYLWIFMRGKTPAKFVASVLMITHIVGYRLSVESVLVSLYASLLIMGGAAWLIEVLSNLKSFGGGGIAVRSSRAL